MNCKKMPPTYLFGLPHTYEKHYATKWNSVLPLMYLKILRVSSLGFMCIGFFLQVVASQLYYNAPSPAFRGNTTTINSFEKGYDTIAIEAIHNIGLWSIAVGACSFLNYSFYTGIPNIFSCIDFLCVCASGINFILKNHALILHGYKPIVVMHAWTAATVFVYAIRTSAKNQIYVHAMGYCGLLMWYILINNKYIFSKY
jgi:hypothetical protein